MEEFQAKDFEGAVWRYLPVLKDNFKFSETEMLSLLGNMPRETYLAGVNSQTGSLTKNQMERVSLLLGIQKALLILFHGHKDRAFSWIDRNNTLPPFLGMTPREFITAGKFKNLQYTRKMLDLLH